MSIAVALICIGCTSLGVGNRHQAMGLVIAYGLAEGASPKDGVRAETLSGRSLFGGSLGKGLSTNTYFGDKGGLPEIVRVTWRSGEGILLDLGSGRWKGGQIAGDHTIPVRSRIPKEVLDYALAGPNRVLRLIFRVKDDGVLLAWDVQEAISLPQFNTGGTWVYAMHGGDLPCEVPRQGGPNCTEGPLEKAPWFNPSWIRGR
ncbi:MAG TPA: hypothetical protein VFR90_04030 [Methylibium sp.]|uniref:hypothetical protein n=1 Tax=Methylibium sp. TaxID=2067992 RepID=UPI002DBCFF0F|nr:hypothetical protein [Methylibium sp.]HEU4458268.1 hypothetical protein [Methylibium sp.]